LLQVSQSLVQLLGLPLHQFADVGARRAPSALYGDDVLDLVEREPEPLRLPNEREKLQRLRVIDAVARGGAPGWRQDATSLVQPQSLPGRARTPRHITDQQAVSSHVTAA
jgi:hypothetical protein